MAKKLNKLDLLKLPSIGTPNSDSVAFAAKSDGLYQKIGAVENKLATIVDTVANASKLNNQSASYYLDYKNFSNKPTILTKTQTDGYYAPKSHSHSYLPLSGGTLSGDLSFTKQVSKIRLSTGSDGNAYIGSSGLGGNPVDEDYGVYISSNAYRDADGKWYHGRTNVIDAYRFKAGYHNHFLWSYSPNVGAGEIAFIDLMSLRSNGNLGIGTTSPAYKLDVSGTGRFTENLTAKGFIRTGSSNNYVLLGGGSHKAVSDFVDRTSNQTIGGVKSFTDDSFFRKNIILGQSLNSYIHFSEVSDGDGFSLLYDGAGGADNNFLHITGGIGSVNNQTKHLTIRRDSGNVGIGTTSPAYKLDVSGDVRATGTFRGSLTGNASSATNINTLADNSSNAARFILFSDAATGNQRAKTDTGLKYNPSSNTITATLAGNASSATKVNNKLTLKFDTGTTENTNLYTYDGSATKTIDIKAGSNVSMLKSANSVTINATNTTYSTGTLVQLKAGNDTTGRLQSAKLLNDWLNDKGYITSYVNTTYSAMSVEEGKAGSATSLRTMRADYLKQIIQYYDTNSVTGIRAGATNTNTNAAVTNPYIKVLDDSTYRGQIRLLGSGATTVESDASGNITISSTDNNTIYTHPSHTARLSGLYKITVNNLGHISGATAVVKKDITDLGIPAQDTTYGVATTSANGLMSSTDKSKLNDIESGANKYTHPTKHPASIITQDASNRFVTDVEKSTWNGVVTDFGNLEIGGRNLLVGEQTNVQAGSVIKNIIDKYHIEFIKETPVNNDHIMWNSTGGAVVDALAGEYITFSAYYKSDFKGSMNLRNGVESKSVTLESTNDNWVRVTITTKVIVDNPSVWVYFMDYRIFKEYGTFEVLNWQLEKGNKATDWFPAPEDQVSDWNTTDVNSFSYIKNKPTTLSGYGITDAVTLNTAQTITGVKTFNAGIILGVNKYIKGTDDYTGVRNVDNLLWRFGSSKVGSVTNIRSEKVGIGTDTPSEKLDVVGNIKASGTLTAPKIDFGNGFTLEASGTQLVMKYNGVIRQRFLSDGSIASTNELAAHQ